jgi:hypothetical protein
MTKKVRELTLRALDGSSNQELILHLFHISRHARAEELLEYITMNRLCGLELLSLIRIEFGGSVLNFMADIVKRIDRDIIKRPIIVGRDWA